MQHVTCFWAQVCCLALHTSGQGCSNSHCMRQLPCIVTASSVWHMRRQRRQCTNMWGAWAAAACGSRRPAKPRRWLRRTGGSWRRPSARTPRWGLREGCAPRLFTRALLHLSSCPNLRCIQHSLVLRWHHGPAPRPLGKVPRSILSGQPPARQRPRSRWLGGERVAAQAAVPHMQLLHRFQRADASDGWLQRAWADALAAAGRLPEAAMHFEARPPPLAHPG